jgi:NitT/TauT family transport system ATP-binding protein
VHGQPPRAAENLTDALYVRCERVRKVYESGGGAVEAIRSIDLAVKESQFVSVIGPSGCGKSTLLMMIAGLESVSAGEIWVAQRPMDGPRTEIGIMFQDPTLLPWKSVLENVLFPIRMMRVPVIGSGRSRFSPR